MYALTKTRSGPGYVELIDHRPAAPEQDQVQLRVLAVGICGTDLHIEAGEYGVEPNRAMIATFCAEQLAQGLVSAPIPSESVFAAFESSP